MALDCQLGTAKQQMSRERVSGEMGERCEVEQREGVGEGRCGEQVKAGRRRKEEESWASQLPGSH